MIERTRRISVSAWKHVKPKDSKIEKVRKQTTDKIRKKLFGIFMSVVMVAGGITTGGAGLAHADDGPEIPQDGLIADYSFTQEPSDGVTVTNSVYGIGDAIVQNESTAVWEDNALKFSGAGTSVNNPEGTWVSLPNDILSGKTSATVSIEVKPSTAILAKNHFLWSIGNSNTDTYWFANTLAPRTTIKYGDEKTVQSSTKLTADRWYSITSVIDAETKTLSYYIDGVKVGEALDTNMSLAQLTDQSRNTIGLAPYNDPLFEGSVSNFRVYDRALSSEEVKSISDADLSLHQTYFDQLMQESLEGISDVQIDKAQTKLPSYEGTVTWVSNSPAVTIAEDGITATIEQPPSNSDPLTGTLTAIMTIRGQSASKEVGVTVFPKEDLAVIPTRGLIADYSFVEAPTDGRTIINQSESTEAVGTAIVQNEATAIWEENSLVFSGEGTSVSSPTGTWVSLPNDILSGKSSATISIEVKPSGINNNRFHFLWSIGNSGTSNYWFTNLLDPRTSIKYGDSEKTAQSPSKLVGDRWYSVTSVIDAKMESISYYIDGVKVGEMEDDGMSLTKVMDQTRNTIGLAPYNDPLFQGSVSTFRVYDRALSDEEIKFISDADAQIHAGPAEPTGLAVNEITVTAEGSAMVSLKWDNVTDANYYNIYRSIAGQDTYEKLESTSETYFKDETVSLSTNYDYKITAVSLREVESVPSTTVTAEVQIPTEAPTAPTELSVTGVITRNSVGLKWTASAGSSEYIVYRSDNVNGTFVEIGRSLKTTFTDSNVDTTTKHYYQVKALNYAGLSNEASNMAESPIFSPPSAPTGVRVVSTSDVRADISWELVTGADVYNVYAKDSATAEFSLIGTTSNQNYTIEGLIEDTDYEVAVSAARISGESDPSASVAFQTKSPMKFDFGFADSPVLKGYTGVTPSTIYSTEMGYGVVDASTLWGRDRGPAANPAAEPLRDLFREWISGANWQFNVDLPNGLYDVAIYSGDLAGRQGGSVIIEEFNYGGVGGARDAVIDRRHDNVIVADGQMSFQFDGAINGVVIIPVLESPTDLTLDEKNMDPLQPFIKLIWSGNEEASKYLVYRQGGVSNTFVLIGDTQDEHFTDYEVDVGVEYVYRVTLKNAADLETGSTNELPVSLVDPDIEIPNVPQNLQYGTVNKNDVTIQWDESTGATSYYIYRANGPDETFEPIGRTHEASYTDTNVLTTISYYYKVQAVSAGGGSELSETLITPAVTVLDRQAEYLDRGLVAVKTDDGVYTSWRMLGTDPAAVSFDLYRDGLKINEEPITSSTNYLDPEGTLDSNYQIKAIDGIGPSESEVVEVWNQQYLSIPIDQPAGGVSPDGESYTYYANDASTGDLDGDGHYEIILKWEALARDNSHAGYTTNTYFDAYKTDGTKLWRIDVGKNVRAGAHYSPFLVYDFDGDGKSEIVFKTADGTVDAEGNIIGDPDANWRNAGGYILEGPEYLTIFDGETGEELDTIDYEPARGKVEDWGDGYGNRVDRHLAAVAYLNGETPSIVMTRGYYAKTMLAAYNFVDGKLKQQWIFDSTDPGNENYAGQGNHNLSVADVDRDGLDEIIYGASVIDHDGSGLYSTGWGHGDAMHVSDFDPERPGLEIYQPHEWGHGFGIRDAETGEELWNNHPTEPVDVGRGLIADIDPSYKGAEFWSSSSWDGSSGASALFSVEGEHISENRPSINHAVWWDGDLLRELLDHKFTPGVDPHGYPIIDKWDWENEQSVSIYKPEGVSSNNYTKGNPSLQADLFGDWREEVIWPSSDSTELQIHTTVDLTEHRIYTLMHDPVYRLGIAWQNAGYNQPPHTSFYLGTDMEEPPVPHLKIVSGPTAPSVPSVPTAVTASGEDGKVILSWHAADGANSYNILRSDIENGEYTVVGNSDTVNYTDVDVVNGQTYYYRVVALNVVGEGKASETVSATPTSANPGSGGGSSSGSTSNVGNPDSGTEQQLDNATIVVNSPQADKGKITVKIDQGKKKVLIPANATAVNGQNKLSLEAEDVTAVIPAEVLEALKKMVPEEELNNYQISVTMGQVDQVKTNELLSNAQQKSKANITVAGDLLEFYLALVSSKGETLVLDQFEVPILLSLKLNDRVNIDLTGIYSIQDSGDLGYVGGTVKENRIEGGIRQSGIYSPLEYKKMFLDVPVNFWAEPAITLLASKHIISGISDREFVPERRVTRAEFASMVARALNLETSDESKFDDVSEEAWYAEAIAASHKAGIIFGKTESEFDPDAAITRQEMTVLIIRAYEYMIGTNFKAAEQSSFADHNQINTWAQEDVDAAYELGLTKGKGNNRFDPHSVLTRAESAQALVNLLKALK